MSVNVFDATGKIRRLVVVDLLGDGHSVTAYVRNPAKRGITDANLTTVTGELSDRYRIGEAVPGADAVISALGPTLKPGSK